jgi:hypothetical protein
MASNVRFLDQVPVSAYSSTTAKSINTGSFMITGSVDSSNKLTFTKGDGSTFDLQVAASASSADALITASVSGSTMTFTKGDASTFNVTLPSSSGGGSDITFQSNPAQIIQDIDVQNFDPNVAVSFTGNKLKFVFGTPTAPTPSFSSLSGFNQDRFNKVFDTYNLIGTFSIGGYDLISASMFETTGGGNVLIQNVGTGNGFNISQTTTGSVSYQMQITASSPMDGTIYSQSFDQNGNLSKSSPAIPTIAYTPDVQLGAASNEIELGATGSITFAESAGAANGWVFVPGTLTTNVSSPIIVTESDTSDISISASAAYSSSGVDGSDNDPAETTSVTSATKTYSRIRSLRFGTSTKTSFTESELLDLESWDTTLGGSVGNLYKGIHSTSDINNYAISTTWSGNMYFYIVYGFSDANPLTEAVGALGNELPGVFDSPIQVGQYRVYRSKALKPGGTGTTINYTLKI